MVYSHSPAGTQMVDGAESVAAAIGMVAGLQWEARQRGESGHFTVQIAGRLAWTTYRETA
jgi:hypothetical protein